MDSIVAISTVNRPTLWALFERVLESPLPFLALAGVVLWLAASFALAQAWGVGGDFWEHAAVVRELATHPFAPVHPLFALNLPHAFFSPYAVGLGILAYLKGSSAIRVLQWAGIANVALFLTAFYWFAKRLLGRASAAWIALLLTMVFWGLHAWYWSGFFHLHALVGTASYPSTFAAMLTLTMWGLCIVYLQGGNWKYLLLLTPLGAVVLLTHPTTALAMVVGVAALAVGFGTGKQLRSRALLLAVIPCAFLIAFLWPYYPFFSLITEDSAAFASQSRPLYEDVLPRIWPALVGIPLLIVRLQKNRRDPLVLMFLALTAIYLYGLFSGHWGYGRVIAYVVLVLHLALAGWLAGLLGRWQEKPQAHILVLGTLLLAILAVMSQSAPDYRGLEAELRQPVPPAAPYAVLSKYVGQYDVVMAELGPSGMVPPFSGKVIAAAHPVYFLPDYAVRRQELERFFEPATPARERRAILDKYHAGFLLLTKDYLAENPLAQFAPFGHIVYENGGLTLMQVTRDSVAP